MIEIQLSQNKVALVDDEDYWLVMQFTWHACEKRGLWYARHSFKQPDKMFGYSMYMHSLILNTTNRIDHINRNGLFNLKENLRLATTQQNTVNSKKRLNTSSRFKGVSWKNGKWVAQIKINGISKHLGVFEIEEDAARMYDDAAILAHGEFHIRQVI